MCERCSAGQSITRDTITFAALPCRKKPSIRESSDGAESLHQGCHVSRLATRYGFKLETIYVIFVHRDPNHCL